MNAQIHTIKGTYGLNSTPCNVFIYDDGYQMPWYVVKGSSNVNQSPEDLYDEIDNNFVNVEAIQDIDCFTWSSPINSEEELLAAMNYADDEE